MNRFSVSIGQRSGPPRFLVLVASAHLAFWGAICLDSLEMIPVVIRQAVVFFFMALVPGAIMLRLLDRETRSSIERILLSLGLSIIVVMTVGLVTNTILPLAGYSAPISEAPVIFALSAFDLSMLAIIVVRRKAGFNDLRFNITLLREVTLAKYAIFLVLPLLSVAGALLANHQGVFALSIVAVVALVFVAVVVSVTEFIPRPMYPIAVLSFSLSLILGSALISNHLWGWDIHQELYYSREVVGHLSWDSASGNNVNGAISITLFAPMLAAAASIDIVWVLKLCFPVIFSTVPLVLYLLFRRQTDEKTAFLSTIFFMSLFVFYGEMLSMARQQIAELLLALTILMLTSRPRPSFGKSSVMIVLMFGIVVSHYSIALFLLIMLVGARIISAFRTRNHDSRSNGLSATIVMILFALSVLWYNQVTNASTFNQAVNTGFSIVQSAFSDLFSSESSQGVGLVVAGDRTLIHVLEKGVHLSLQFLVVAGFAYVLRNRNSPRLAPLYRNLSSVCIILLVTSLALPYFAGTLNTSRWYHICLIILSPMAVFGAYGIAGIVTKTLRRGQMATLSRLASIRTLSILLSAFLLFNSGVALSLLGHSPSTFSPIYSADGPVYTQEEVECASWIKRNLADQKVRADLFRYQLLIGYGIEYEFWSIEGDSISDSPFAFLGERNIADERVYVLLEGNDANEYLYIPLDSQSFHARVYDNGASWVISS